MSAIPTPDAMAGSAMFETQLVRWLKGRVAEYEAAAQSAAAGHYLETYARKSGAADAYREVLAVVDPMGGRP